MPTEYGIVGLGPVTLTVQYAQATAGVLTDLMSFHKKRQYQLASLIYSHLKPEKEERVLR